MDQERQSLLGWIVKDFQRNQMILVNEDDTENDLNQIGIVKSKEILKPHYPMQLVQEKIMDIPKIFKLTQPITCIKIISKLAYLFDIKLKQLGDGPIQNLSDVQHESIANLEPEYLMADTNRKHFQKSFCKAFKPSLVLVPTTSVKANPKKKIDQLTIIIEIDPLNNKKFQIRFLTFENLLLDIVSNLQFDNFSKVLHKICSVKLNTVSNIICFFHNIQKVIEGNIYKFLIQKFQHVLLFSQIQNYSQKQQIHQQKHGQRYQQNVQVHRGWWKMQKNIYIQVSDKYLVMATYKFPQNNLQIYRKKYKCYLQINNLIFKQPILPSLNQNIFFQNEFCVNIYGMLYNFIRNQGLQQQPIHIIHYRFIQYLANQKKMIQQKMLSQNQSKAPTRPLGHYPVKIEKGCKVCCVCQGKKKKSRFKCQLCSQTYGRDIALCIAHFKQFHENKQKYIPKGVRTGADQKLNKQLNNKKLSTEDKIRKARDLFFKIENERNQKYPIISIFKNIFYQERCNQIHQMYNYHQMKFQGMQQMPLPLPPQPPHPYYPHYSHHQYLNTPPEYIQNNFNPSQYRNTPFLDIIKEQKMQEKQEAFQKNASSKGRPATKKIFKPNNINKKRKKKDSDSSYSEQ